ncbi:MAG: hypothetical protein RBS68_15765 [Anaerolineales bacterium]|jgi:hypothetical protein|nr:hypothetical protein [Anaerolineales bacterium]
MTLIRDASASNTETVHRVREIGRRCYVAYCGQEISIAHSRPANRPGAPRCPACHRYYKTNLGQPPAHLSIMPE